MTAIKDQRLPSILLVSHAFSALLHIRLACLERMNAGELPAPDIGLGLSRTHIDL